MTMPHKITLLSAADAARYTKCQIAVTVFGEAFTVAYDVDTDACDRPYAIASLVQLGGQWYEVAALFSEAACDEIDAALNRRVHTEAT